MDNPATPPIVGYVGSATTDTQTYWLDVAWRALQGEDRGLVARIQAGLIDAKTVADIITAAARRVLRNPEGVTEESGSLDDYSESWKRKDATEDVYFTAAELRRLAPDAATYGGFVGSVKYLG